MNRSKLIAFVVAPATPALITVIPALFTDTPVQSVWGMFMLVSIVTYAHAVVLGVPAALLLSRKGTLTWFRVVGAAFLIGALPLGALTLYQEFTIPPGAGYEANGVVLRTDGRLTSAGQKSAIFGVLQGGGFGAATGLVWWFIARPRARRLAG